MRTDAHDAYLESRILSAGPTGLVVILYQTALGAIQEARACLSSGDVAGRGRAITRAQSVVLELSASLRPAAGDLSANLARLYDYVGRRLIEANFKQEDAPLAEAAALLATLLEGWEAAHAWEASAHISRLAESCSDSPSEWPLQPSAVPAQQYAPQGWTL